ncbi:class I SAM-dependent methyltransferase [Thermococcus sp.]|uniref:class I SAM-dependent methyltransferase n=1 Tax=Thermococcus sp. TaxID=35749 RepID=UPI0026392AAB|nr:class I SAM-dependent methyltransferase [Thermococcus sp.]
MSFREKYARIARHYEALERPLDRYFCPLRRKAISFIEGKRVLEVGVGVGKTLKYYPRDVELCGIDAVPGALEIAGRKAEELGLNACFKEADVERLPFPDGSFDTVVSSFVFCTVPNPEKGMEEILRVLRPGGRVIFIEHTRSDSKLVDYLFLRPMKLLLKPLLDDDPLRETHKLVKRYFEIEHEEDHYGGVVRLIVGRNSKKI